MRTHAPYSRPRSSPDAGTSVPLAGPWGRVEQFTNTGETLFHLTHCESNGVALAGEMIETNLAFFPRDADTPDAAAPEPEAAAPEPEPEAAASQDMDVDREQGFWHERGTLADLEGVWCAQGDNLPEGGVAVCVNRGGDFLLHNQSCKMAQKGVRGPTADSSAAPLLALLRARLLTLRCLRSAARTSSCPQRVRARACTRAG
eukprot:COSAG04_NODE_2390_length_4219_cov_2.436165_6_plen_202_part_00